jgi:hypothetical protein
MADTIRSGIDDFYRMAQWGGILSVLKLRKGFGQNVPSTLSEMKELYDSIFQQLTHCTSSVKGVGPLLSLLQIMLLFMTIYIPWFLSSFSGSESSSYESDIIAAALAESPRKPFIGGDYARYAPLLP